MSRPIFLFRESISPGNSTTFLVKSPNKMNKVCIRAEPLNQRLIKAIESGKLGGHIEESEIIKILQYYGWKKSDSRNVWAFGPGEVGPNILVDKTQGSKFLRDVQEYIVQGFRWSASEGPLCGEPYYGIKFSLLDCQLHENISERGVGQIMPTMKRACYGAILSSKPTLLEAIYKIQVIVPEKYVKEIYKVFLKGRRKLLTAVTTSESAITVVFGEVPITESLGITNEIKARSSGKATLVKVFGHYEGVPGNPLISDGGLARQYVEQIRKRKQMQNISPPGPDDYRDE